MNTASYIALSIVQLTRIVLEQYELVQQGQLTEEEFVARWGQSVAGWAAAKDAWEAAASPPTESTPQ